MFGGRQNTRSWQLFLCFLEPSFSQNGIFKCYERDVTLGLVVMHLDLFENLSPLTLVTNDL